MKRDIERIIQENHKSKVEALSCLIDESLQEIERTNYELYKQIKYEVYTLANGYHLTQEIAEEWVANMHNKDGTHGEHWSIEQTDALKGKYDRYDFYAVLNMMYSDYCNARFTTNDYVQLASDWLDDKDTESDKTLKYFMFVVD